MGHANGHLHTISTIRIESRGKKWLIVHQLYIEINHMIV